MKTFSILLVLGSLAISAAAQPAAPAQRAVAVVEPANGSTALPQDYREKCHEAEGWREQGEHGKFRRCWLPLLLILAVVHLLLTIVVAKDIQQTHASVIWIFIALIAGLPGTAVYALFRIGNILSKDKTA